MAVESEHILLFGTARGTLLEPRPASPLLGSRSGWCRSGLSVLLVPGGRRGGVLTQCRRPCLPVGVRITPKSSGSHPGTAAKSKARTSERGSAPSRSRASAPRA